MSLQIAAPDSPDEPERMVIITGPPEAQFKVKAIIQSFMLLFFRIQAPLGRTQLRVFYINLFIHLSFLLYSSVYVCVCVTVGTGEDIWEIERGEFFHS